jgi:hypothetical protein
MKEETPNPTIPGEEQEPQVFALSREAGGTKFNRRQFLEVSAAAAAVASLAGCAGIPSGLLPESATAVTSSTRETTVNFQNAPLFKGPGTSYDRITMLKQNDVLRIISRTSDGNWLQVATSDGEIGWISAAFVDLQTPLDSIPIDEGAPVQPDDEQPAEQANAPQPSDTSAPTATEPPPPTDTPEPTATATIEPTTAPQMTGTVIVTSANVRIAPIANIQPIINLSQGEMVTILGRSNDNVWVLVDTGKSTSETKKQLIGWMKVNQLSITMDNVATLPIATPNPTPTPLPGSADAISPGSTGIKYEYVDEWGISHYRTLPCGSAIPAGSVCVCNCVTVPVACSCDNYSPCSCDTIHYWYPN